MNNLHMPSTTVYSGRMFLLIVQLKMQMLLFLLLFPVLRRCVVCVMWICSNGDNAASVNAWLRSGGYKQLFDQIIKVPVARKKKKKEFSFELTSVFRSWFYLLVSLHCLYCCSLWFLLMILLVLLLISCYCPGYFEACFQTKKSLEKKTYHYYYYQLFRTYLNKRRLLCDNQEVSLYVYKMDHCLQHQAKPSQAKIRGAGWV